MDLSSWLRRALLKNPTKNQNPNSTKQQNKQQQNHQRDEALGVTPQLIDFVKSFTPEAFRSFPLQDEEEGGSFWVDDSWTTSANSSNDLSEWQERHATLVLAEVKEISHLRYILCPRYLKERQFWRIYFLLVKNYTAESSLFFLLKSNTIEKEKANSSAAVIVRDLDRLIVKVSHFRYELRAVRIAKLKKMAIESEKPSGTSAYEVEMAETKQATATV